MQTVAMLGLSMVSVPSDSSSVKHSSLGSLVLSSTMSIVTHSVESVLENVSVPLASVKSLDARKGNNCVIMKHIMMMHIMRVDVATITINLRYKNSDRNDLSLHVTNTHPFGVVRAHES